MQRRLARRIPFAFATVAALLAVSSASRAEVMPRLTVDWSKLLDQGSALIETQSVLSKPEARPLVAQPELGSTWIGVAPRMSLVVRDWAGAQKLAGGQLALTDAMRSSRSLRMVVTRLRFGAPGTRLVPFVQAGLGEWRVDTDVLPLQMRDQELAAHFGGGFECRMTKGWLFAAETGATVLYRETHEPQQVVSPRMWNTFLASRVVF